MPTVAPLVHAPTTPQRIDTTFDASLAVPVTGLSPTSTPTALRSHIEANVALVWPYSNSTATFSLLLVDHTSRGQVKVVFRGGCAKQVANTKVGIGDKIKLALVGCEWKETVDILSTPGKRLEWDLQFHSRLVLQIHSQDRSAILLDYTAPDSQSTVPISDTENILRARNSAIKASLNGLALQKPSAIQVPYLTPSKPTRQPTRGNFFASSFATLANDDGYIVGRGRKRTKFARHSGDWDLVDDERVAPDTNSPRGAEVDGNKSEFDGAVGLPVEARLKVVQQKVGNNEAPRMDSDTENESPPRTAPVSSDLQQEMFEDVLIEAALDKHMQQKSSVISTTDPHPSVPPQGATVMGPPSTPLKQLHLSQNPDILLPRTGERDVDRATTPRILPLASPGLPLVSPLVQQSGVEVGYFPIFQEGLSQLDASGGGRSDHSAIDPMLEISDNKTAASDESPVIVEERVSESWELQERRKSDSPSDTQIFASYNHAIQPNDYPTPEQTQPSLLPDQWLSTLEASIAQELSNNDQPSPVNVESEPTVFVAETHSHPNVPAERLHNIHTTGVMGVETGDLYGAPEGDLTETPEPQPQISQTEHGDLHAPFQLSQSEISASTFFTSNHMVDITAVDVVEPSVHAHWATDALRLDAAVTASDFSSFPVHDQVEGAGWIESLDGNVESRERFHEDAASTGNQPGTILPDQRSEIHIDDQQQSASVRAEHTELPTESNTDLANQDLDIKSPAHEQHAAPAIPLFVHQSSASVDYTHLPTPDQTQKENNSLDYRPEVVPAENQITLPSPQPSQEKYKTDISEKDPDNEPASQSATQAFQVATPSGPRVVAPLRSSQRLSSRNTALSKSISSPFFTPRRSARFSTSPSREETIPPSSPLSHTYPSSPNQTLEHQERSTDMMVHQLPSPVLPSFEPLATGDSGLTTPLAYYPRLSSLNEHFGQLIDVIAVCTRSSSKAERAKAGPKDYHTSLHLIDLSCELYQNPHVLAQVFRPMKKALPTAQAGDVVILHNFKVHTVKRNFALLSSDTSSWAVISFSSNSSKPKVVSSGPPLEQGSSEADYAWSLFRWWNDNITSNQMDYKPDEGHGARESSDGPATRTRLRVARQVLGSTTSPRQSSKSLPAARRRRANLTDNFSNEGDGGQALEDSDRDDTPSPRADRISTRRDSTVSTAPSTATQNQDRETTPRRSGREARSPSVVHELRDGTKYVDEPDRRGSSVVHELRDGLTYIDE
ncbi:uncharacterized protein A1O9_12212 [Exophiala aquamarina CBS 119918]|uniref:Telomeric single stranded DNA binding POT1/Cdc13 domain-containing protein n=1 Tax=Exophiala aquamarina CBS 119918 TaxID=1182545 RepID=A0A072NVI7_9EURO|nr:uncharacterized protein A1O9_12212 [Exophiala aquamarina CBS 119918]KEF51874.1 hypothetical protein A1O9_12212 [Exophiala aquamarina CBS 119918]